jgi:hypothetical protein
MSCLPGERSQRCNSYRSPQTRRRIRPSPPNSISGWPSMDAAQGLYEQLLAQRAVQAYMLTLPTLNIVGMRDGSQSFYDRTWKPDDVAPP